MEVSVGCRRFYDSCSTYYSYKSDLAEVVYESPDTRFGFGNAESDDREVCFLFPEPE